MDVQNHLWGSYLPVLIIVLIAIFLGSFLLFLNRLLGQKPTERTDVKFDTYECGVPYEGNAHQQFSVRYYLVGIIFLIFDVEVIFMYPWTLVYKHVVKTNPVIFYEMLFFILLLLGGYIYLRRRNAFSWD